MLVLAGPYDHLQPLMYSVSDDEKGRPSARLGITVCAVEHPHERPLANVRVAESLFRKATGEGREAVTAAIFWLKTRARWKEVSVHEHGGADSPLSIVVTYEDQKLL